MALPNLDNPTDAPRLTVTRRTLAVGAIPAINA